MKHLMILGGMIGFMGSGILSWMAREEAMWLLIKACLATCIGGLMLRWWGQLWLSSLKVAVQEEMAQQTLQTEIDDPNPEERKET
ncbi:MAG: hypothetical protein ACPG4V_14225 [Limisphaerales bacterium]|jgi:hypothetical protein